MYGDESMVDQMGGFLGGDGGTYATLEECPFFLALARHKRTVDGTRGVSRSATGRSPPRRRLPEKA